MKVAISTSGLGKTFCHGWGNPASFSMDGVSLEIPAGETTGVFGGNGSGKTLLLCSHYLSRMEEFCGKALILHEGETVYLGKPAFAPDLENWLLNHLKN